MEAPRDCIYLALIMYQIIPPIEDILHLEHENSVILEKVRCEAIYEALLCELIKHSPNASTSSLLFRLKMEAAARIKSGQYSEEMFSTWAKTTIRRYVFVLFMLFGSLCTLFAFSTFCSCDLGAFTLQEDLVLRYSKPNTIKIKFYIRYIEKKYFLI